MIPAMATMPSPVMTGWRVGQLRFGASGSGGSGGGGDGGG
jgi:hypothetical protein